MADKLTGVLSAQPTLSGSLSASQWLGGSLSTDIVIKMQHTIQPSGQHLQGVASFLTCEVLS